MPVFYTYIEPSTTGLGDDHGGDIKLRYDPVARDCDIEFTAPDLEVDGGLESAVLISLFSDARATAEDLADGNPTDKRGYWGDAVAPDAGDVWGSKLWLLERAKITAETLQKAKEWAKAALQWLVDDHVAKSVTVEVERMSTYGLAFQVQIQRLDKPEENYEYTFVWGDIQ